MKDGKEIRLWQTAVNAIEKRSGPRQPGVGRRVHVFGQGAVF